LSKRGNLQDNAGSKCSPSRLDAHSIIEEGKQERGSSKLSELDQA
jgi:hypothetical protein